VEAVMHVLNDEDLKLVSGGLGWATMEDAGGDFSPYNAIASGETAKTGGGMSCKTNYSRPPLMTASDTVWRAWIVSNCSEYDWKNMSAYEQQEAIRILKGRVGRYK
jgi:hypothetical protein